MRPPAPNPFFVMTDAIRLRVTALELTMKAASVLGERMASAAQLQKEAEGMETWLKNAEVKK